MSTNHDRFSKPLAPTLRGAPEYRGEGEIQVRGAFPEQGGRGANHDAQALPDEASGRAARGPGGEKRGEFFAGMGPPCTRSAGEERGAFFATGAVSSGESLGEVGPPIDQEGVEIKSLRYGAPLAVPPEGDMTVVVKDR